MIHLRRALPSDLCRGVLALFELVLLVLFCKTIATRLYLDTMHVQSNKVPIAADVQGELHKSNSCAGRLP